MRRAKAPRVRSLEPDNPIERFIGGDYRPIRDGVQDCRRVVHEDRFYVELPHDRGREGIDPDLGSSN